MAKTTAQAAGTARASGAIGLKFLTIHVTPEPSGMAAAGIHSQNVQFDGTGAGSFHTQAQADGFHKPRSGQETGKPMLTSGEMSSVPSGA